MTDAETAGQVGSENLRQHYEDFERRRQFVLLYLFNGVACFFLFVFGISAIYKGRHVLAMMMIFLVAITFTNILLLKFTKKQRFARTGFICGVIILFGYLIVSGGVNNTGPLWCYPCVAATFFLQGARRGSPVIVVFFLVAIFAFYFPPHGIEVADYSSDFKLRFISTFLALSIFVGLHEFARARNQDELYRVSDRLDQISKLDQLTNLPNRRYMIDRLEAENSRFARHARPFSILYADIDNFKTINDRHGHQVGDNVLKTIAQKIRATLRHHDEASRWGGEEFLIMLPETDQDMAKEVAEKLRAAVAAIEFKHGDTSLHLTMSFGVHTINQVCSLDDAINLSDKRLYVAKNSGKNRVVTNIQE
jgi:diguanylate cyclase (GGDEF)-like protein